MEKRGQVTIFVIVGVVVLILAALVLYLREEQGFLVAPADFLSSQLQPLQLNIEECVTQAVAPGVTFLGKQGGSFSPSNYRLYQDQKVRYFCQNIPGKNECLNVIPPLESITTELGTYLSLQVNNCVDRELLNSLSGVEVSGTQEVTVDTQLTEGLILVTVDYDITLTRDEATVSLPTVKKSFDAPIEELYFVARDIVQEQARVGNFDQLVYMLNKKGAYEINLDKPFPDTIYMINKKNSNYQLWFAIEGEST